MVNHTDFEGMEERVSVIDLNSGLYLIPIWSEGKLMTVKEVLVNKD